MEICDKCEVFTGLPDDGDYAFEYSTIIVKEGESCYYANTNERCLGGREIDPLTLDLVPIPTSEIWPPFSEEFTQAPEPLP